MKEFSKKILSLETHSILPRIKLEIEDNVIVYLRYNDHKEYSYQIIFSNEKNDWIRFDNYDEHWDVSSKPNHKHIRYKDEVIESPMIGEPNTDIPILNQIIISNTK